MNARELDFYETTIVTASKVPESFTSPDDDWVPILFLLTKEQERVMIPLHDYMDDDRHKDLLFKVLLPPIIQDLEAEVAVLVVSTWTSKASSDLMSEQGKYVPPSTQPDREEYVFVMEYTAAGVTRQTCAQILRSETEIPRLGEWKDMPAASSPAGRMVDPIVEALRAV